MDLIRTDLKAILKMMEQLDTLAAVEGVFSVEIRFKTEAEDVITIGYSENGDPAVTSIKSEPVPAPKVHITPFTINRDFGVYPFDRPLGASDYNEHPDGY